MKSMDSTSKLIQKSKNLKFQDFLWKRIKSAKKDEKDNENSKSEIPRIYEFKIFFRNQKSPLPKNDQPHPFDLKLKSVISKEPVKSSKKGNLVDHFSQNASISLTGS